MITVIATLLFEQFSVFLFPATICESSRQYLVLDNTDEIAISYSTNYTEKTRIIYEKKKKKLFLSILLIEN